MEPLSVEEECRPAVIHGFTFGDNAGGSQCLKEVADRIYDYLLRSNVQLGADYSLSVQATKRATLDPQISTATLINALSPNEINFGSCSTVLVENLARSLEADVQPDEELIVSFADHETNIGPWTRLATRKGVKLHPWQARPVHKTDDPFDVALQVEDLASMITSKTRLVSFTACSDILGGFTNVKSTIALIRKIAREKRARKVEVCVDCVAYAPHRQINVQEWDVDYAFFSYYKVYGPHVSALYTRASCLQGSVMSLGHYFLGDPKYKLQLGGPGYEVTYGTTAVLPYLLGLGTKQASGKAEQEVLQMAFQRIAEHEQTLLEILIGGLLEKHDAGVRIVGPRSTDSKFRAPTVSFVIVSDDGKTKKILSKDVVAWFDSRENTGIRFGHFYSHRLIGSLGLDPDDCIIRISLVHYNTKEDVMRCLGHLNDFLSRIQS